VKHFNTECSVCEAESLSYDLSADPSLDNLDVVTIVASLYPIADSHWHVLDKCEVALFNGLIDEVRLYRYALTEDEIRGIYNSSAP
jgi:hypothetical protein